MRGLGATKSILGMDIKLDYANNQLWLNQRKYVETIFHRFSVYECKLVKILILVCVNLYVGQFPKTHEEDVDIS